MSATKDYAIDIMNTEKDGEDFWKDVNDMREMYEKQWVTQQVWEQSSLNSSAICICGSHEIAKDNMCYDCRRKDKKFCSSCNEWIDEEEMYCPDEWEDICIYCRD